MTTFPITSDDESNQRSEASERQEGQTRGMAQRSEDGVGKTSEVSERLERAKAVWTRSAIKLAGSGRRGSKSHPLSPPKADSSDFSYGGGADSDR